MAKFHELRIELLPHPHIPTHLRLFSVFELEKMVGNGEPYTSFRRKGKTQTMRLSQQQTPFLTSYNLEGIKILENVEQDVSI